MYQAQAALFLYAVSPVHMGAGTAFGLIDSPIQRERHSDHPVFAGSGLKGAIRHHFAQKDFWRKDGLLERLFGPEDGELYAGAVSFGDAQLVLFPVRSAKQGYVYVTSPLALARCARQLALLGKPVWQERVASPNAGSCRVAGADFLTDGRLHLEAFDYAATEDKALQGVGSWLAQHALPQDEAHAFFRDKVERHLALLPDEDFSYFVKNATVVEPHVRIDDESGAASDRGLFYVENLPPESLLIAPLLTSRERSGKKEVEAEAVLENVATELAGKTLQIGGDATVGRGQVIVTVLK
ncbi:MAG: type III-B CRISPR module RAMP protein Cmr4 [Pseudomonadota bacterium]